MANLEAQAGVEHVFTVAEVRAQAEHGIFIGTIEGTESDAVGIAVITIADSEVPLVIRVEVQRMEGCQSGGAGTNLVDAVIKVGNAVIDVVNGFRVARYLVVQSRQVFTRRIGLFDEVPVFFDSRFLVDRPGIDGVLGTFLNRRIGTFLMVVSSRSVMVLLSSPS